MRLRSGSALWPTSCDGPLLTPLWAALQVAILKRVNHPHIVSMHEEFDTPARLFLVLQYVDGGELFDRIVEAGQFTEQDASRITGQMTDAIQYLHGHDIVHRDLKVRQPVPCACPHSRGSSRGGIPVSSRFVGAPPPSIPVRHAALHGCRLTFRDPVTAAGKPAVP